MIRFNYIGLPERYVEDKNDFYKSGLKGTNKLRNLCTVCQRVFMVTEKNLELFLLGDGVGYKLRLYANDQHKGMIGEVVYIPDEYRLDVYDSGSSSPLFVWKSKRCVLKNIPVLLDRLKFETLLLPLVSVI